MTLPASTEKAQQIIQLLASGMKAKDVASEIDCSISLVYKVASHDASAALNQAVSRRIGGIAAAKALKLLEDIIDDPDASDTLRVSAAKTVLDKGGFGTQGAASLSDKAPSEMTQDEINNRIAQLQNERANRAQPVVLDNDEPDFLK